MAYTHLHSARSSNATAARLLLLLLGALVTLAAQSALALESDQPSPTGTTSDSSDNLQPSTTPPRDASYQCISDDDEAGSCATLDPFATQQRRDVDNGLHGLEKRQEEPATSSRVVNVPQNAPNGGLSMTQPPITAQATFYKIADSNYITFGWQFTDVLVQPETLTLQAYCSQNGYTYPVGPTQGIAGDSTEYAWNPYDYEASGGATPLAEASYTLRIFDERGYFAAPTAGYMRPYAGTVFALYRPQKYVGLQDGWVCAACSAALRSIPVHPAILATSISVLAGALLVFARIH